jgi:hypothetical protein
MVSYAAGAGAGAAEARRVHKYWQETRAQHGIDLHD